MDGPPPSIPAPLFVIETISVPSPATPCFGGVTLATFTVLVSGTVRLVGVNLVELDGTREAKVYLPRLRRDSRVLLATRDHWRALLAVAVEHYLNVRAIPADLPFAKAPVAFTKDTFT